METQEKIILRNLIRNEDYARKVVPFLRDSYFQENVDKVIFVQRETTSLSTTHALLPMLFDHCRRRISV